LTHGSISARDRARHKAPALEASTPRYPSSPELASTFAMQRTRRLGPLMGLPLSEAHTCSLHRTGPLGCMLAMLLAASLLVAPALAQAPGLPNWCNLPSFNGVPHSTSQACTAVTNCSVRRRSLPCQ
jgi:hypothetical protein